MWGLSAFAERGAVAILLVGVGLAGRGAVDFTSALALPEPPAGIDVAPQCVAVNEIILRADGSGVYDRSVPVDGAHCAWSGQVFDHSGRQLCHGGNTHIYSASAPQRRDRSVEWLLESPCPGIEPGMTFLFQYTSVTGELSNSRYPAKGLGVVVSGSSGN